MNIDCCKSYVGKQIIGLLPNEEECLYYLVINSQDLGAINWTGWLIDGVDVYTSGYYYYFNNASGQSLVISYIGTQPSEVVLDDGFGTLYPFTVEKVTKFGGSCEKVCYQAMFDYGYNLYYIDYFQLGGATPTANAPINIDSEAVLEIYINSLLGTTNADVSSVWNGSKYVVTINNAYNLGGLVFDDGFGNLTTFDVLPCQITPPEPVPLSLLTEYPGAGAAYSVRKLSSSYSGAALRVRRSSDNTEQDIGFSGLNLDTTALTSFVGASSGFITIWYDQSGNARNATQTIAGSQPRIVNAGVIELQNSIPSVRLLGTQFMEIQSSVSNFITSANITHIFSAMIQTSATGTLVGAYQSGSTNRYVVHPTFSGNMYFDCYSDVTSRVTGTQAIFTALTMVDYYRENANMAYYRNNTSIHTKNNATGVFTAYLAKTNLGANRNPSTNPETYMTGFISEFIIYNTSQNSNRNGINTNIMTYYGI